MAVNMTLNGYYAPMLYKPHMLKRRGHDTKFCNVAFSDVPQSYHKNRASFPVWSGTPQKNLVFGSLKGMKLSCRSYASSSFIRGEPGGLPHSIPILPRRGEAGGLSDTMPELPKRKQLYSSTRVSKGITYSHRYTAAAEKPEWWWRVLSCLPYLVPLHAPWMNPELLYQMHPFLENFEFLTYPFLRAYIKLPSFVIMACISGLIIGVVRRRECPHSFRFHVVMGILLESCMHIMGTVSGWLPCEVFWGKFGNLFWSAIAFGYLFTVVECMRCAIAGKYPDIAVLSDAALTHIPYR